MRLVMEGKQSRHWEWVGDVLEFLNGGDVLELLYLLVRVVGYGFYLTVRALLHLVCHF